MYHEEELWMMLQGGINISGPFYLFIYLFPFSQQAHKLEPVPSRSKPEPSDFDNLN